MLGLQEKENLKNPKVSIRKSFVSERERSFAFGQNHPYDHRFAPLSFIHFFHQFNLSVSPMAEQRQSFRFRLPWRQGTSAPRPPRPPPPPAESPTVPTQTTTAAATAPVQRPPFRPPGTAPPQGPPPQAQTSPKSQPSRPSTESTRSRGSRVTPQPASPPSRASTQTGGASQSPSPSRTATESQSAAQPPSPSRSSPQPQAQSEQALQAAPPPQSPPPKLDSEPSVQTTSLPPSSPSLTATKAQSAPGEAVTRPPLPLENLQPATQSPITFPPSSSEPILSVSTEEPKPARSEPESRELQPKEETASENVQNAQNQTQSQVTFQPNEKPAEHSAASVRVTEPPQTSTEAEETLVLNQKSDSSIVSSETKSLPESDRSPGQDREGKKILQEDGSKEKITGVTETLSAAAGADVASQMHPSVAFDAEQKQLEKEEVMGKKETISNPSSHGKEDQTMILNLKDKIRVSESRQEPNISNGDKAPLHKEIRGDISKFLHEMATNQQKYKLGESPAVVVTLAGENRGASMQLGSESAKREGTVHIHRGYKINPDESNTEGEMSFEGQGSQDSKTANSQNLPSQIEVWSPLRLLRLKPLLQQRKGSLMSPHPQLEEDA